MSISISKIVSALTASHPWEMIAKPAVSSTYVTTVRKGSTWEMFRSLISRKSHALTAPSSSANAPTATLLIVLSVMKALPSTMGNASTALHTRTVLSAMTKVL